MGLNANVKDAVAGVRDRVYLRTPTVPHVVDINAFMAATLDTYLVLRGTADDASTSDIWD